MASPIAQLIAQGARTRGLDPQAVLAVAGQEGLSGGVGDNGHAFGPFQLNDAGGVLTGRPGNHQVFAESPAGINWALDQIANVARGLHGSQAVNAIVNRFERPRDPSGEIARALAAYGGQAGGAPPAGPSPGGDAAASLDPRARARAVQALMGSFTHGESGSVSPVLQALQAYRSSGTPGLSNGRTAGSGPAGGGSTPSPGAPGGKSIAELLLEGTGGPTHSTGPHLHFASMDPQAMLAAIKEASVLGLRSAENPYTTGVDQGVHAPNSFHDRTFPGVYNGRHLGEATDFQGDRQQQIALRNWIQSRYR